MANIGRPRKEIDFKLLKKFCELQCTAEEIAMVFMIDADTLNARIREKYNMSFSEYFSKNCGMGRVSLRRYQWALASKGNPAMLIFLGKNYLNQTDKQEIKHPDEVNINITFEDDGEGEDEDKTQG